MKILIVDDEEMIRGVLREYVEFEGNEADEACDGMEAVKMCKERDYDLVLMDIMMNLLNQDVHLKLVHMLIGLQQFKNLQYQKNQLKTTKRITKKITDRSYYEKNN